ncbi:hypothetical protein OG394_13545 [Kribbella sp. NBC_01245]|uniref:hypothetical protein n=1 Tax=Kribbella sp. NBC_01245 TaxID=2903578 RepID=UPI002E2B8312|nr:hypothetical protein [Kribbella sp. NBC_01245]
MTGISLAKVGTALGVATALVIALDVGAAVAAAASPTPSPTGTVTGDGSSDLAELSAEIKRKQREREKGKQGGPGKSISDRTLPALIVETRLVSACVSDPPDRLGQVPAATIMCSRGSDTCNEPTTPAADRQWYFNVWRRTRSGPPAYLALGRWLHVGYECHRPGELPPRVVPARVLTWVDVYNAVRNERAAKKRVVVQPAGRTLVNAETVFSTSGDDWTKYGMVLLGFKVDVEGRPTSYFWKFGDGESLTTKSAGRPYPAKDVTHKYLRKAQRLGVTVTTTYKVRYRVDGGAWQSIEQPLTAVGPATPLGVREAIAVLVDPAG